MHNVKTLLIHWFLKLRLDEGTLLMAIWFMLTIMNVV
jgi:hypothetical protein